MSQVSQSVGEIERVSFSNPLNCFDEFARFVSTLVDRARPCARLSADSHLSEYRGGLLPQDRPEPIQAPNYGQHAWIGQAVRTWLTSREPLKHGHELPEVLVSCLKYDRPKSAFAMSS